VGQRLELRDLEEAVDVAVLYHDVSQSLKLIQVHQVLRLHQSVKQKELEIYLED